MNRALVDLCVAFYLLEPDLGAGALAVRPRDRIPRVRALRVDPRTRAVAAAMPDRLPPVRFRDGRAVPLFV